MGGLATLIFSDLTSNVPIGYEIVWRYQNIQQPFCNLSSEQFFPDNELTGQSVYLDRPAPSQVYTTGNFRKQTVLFKRISTGQVLQTLMFCNTPV